VAQRLRKEGIHSLIERFAMFRRAIPVALALAAFASAPAHAQGTLRIAMTAGDIPATAWLTS
jgi:hypothetical protein